METAMTVTVLVPALMVWRALGSLVAGEMLTYWGEEH